MKLHLQNFSYEEQSRLCLALYHKLGIQCWPSFHKENKGQKFYHIRISGRSLNKIRNNVKTPNNMQYMVPVIWCLKVAARVPNLLPQGSSPKPHANWLKTPNKKWYKSLKNN